MKMNLSVLFMSLLLLLGCSWDHADSYSLKPSWMRLNFRGGGWSNPSKQKTKNTYSSSSALEMLSHHLTSPALKRIANVAKWAAPPLALYLLNKANSKFIPLNKQPVSYFGPFFQGWLIRTIDPSQNITSIFIVGSFSPPKSKQYQEHYIFCAIDKDGESYVHHEFPDPQDVTITNLPAKLKKQKDALNISWKSKKHGYFHFTNEECVVDFRFDHLNISLSARQRIPWSGNRSSSSSSITPFPISSNSGPEGWLEYTHLLPCHYFIYSVGSQTSFNYSISNDLNRSDASPPSSSSQDPKESTLQLSGQGFSHIEGNHGTFFPRGWVWSEGIGANNNCSFSLVIGEFCIGSLTPMNTCLYLRRGNGKVAVIRSIDSDRVKYVLDGKQKKVEIQASSRLKGLSMNVTIEALNRDSFHKVYVPTANGFSNEPGCQETYTAIATIHFYDRLLDRKEDYSIPLTALEFGGSFIDTIHEH